MDLLVDVVVLLSLPGIVIVALVPALLGCGMVALLLLGLVDGPMGGELQRLMPPAQRVKGAARRTGEHGEREAAG